MYDLLTERIIRVKEVGGQLERTTLPGLFALFMQDQVEMLFALRPHQRHGFHSTMVQMAVMGMERAGTRTPPRDEAGWREILEGMTPGYPGHEPWTLVVDDPNAPAFMQPPCDPQGYPEKFHKISVTPGHLDILVHSKMHEVKQNQVRNAEPDDWMMAIVNVQTMENATGSGRKGISRTQSGTCTRPALSLMPLDGWIGAEVRRDILALRHALPGIRERYPVYPEGGGIELVWLAPWDGLPEERLPLEDLHPLYVEICRRLRMMPNVDRTNGSGKGVGRLKESDLIARYTTSEDARIRTKRDWKATGDPWAPVYAESGLVLRLSNENAFSYRDLTRYLLSDEWERPPLLNPTPMEQEEGAPMVMVARATSRDKGKTFGYHERRIILNHRLQRALVDPDERKEAGEIAMERIENAGEVQSELRLAARVFMAGGKHRVWVEGKITKEIKDHERSLNAVGKRFNQLVEKEFFQELQRELEAATAKRPGLRQEWLTDRRVGLVAHARTVLQETIESSPHQGMNAWRARSEAEDTLENMFRSQKGPLHRERNGQSGNGDENHENHEEQE